MTLHWSNRCVTILLQAASLHVGWQLSVTDSGPVLCNGLPLSMSIPQALQSLEIRHLSTLVVWDAANHHLAILRGVARTPTEV